MTVAREWVDLYEDLHEHPELSFQEERTARIVADKLAAFGYEVTTGVGRTGVVGLLRNGDGPLVLMRADMDALPVEENTGLSYASTRRGTDPDGHDVGVAHACGHDVHVTCLLAACEELAAATYTWGGTLMAVFQPAEELGLGAKAMMADGLYERFGTPVVVLGQHVTPLPAGTIGVHTGPPYAAMDGLRIVLHGRGGHASMPDATVDPVVMAASTVMRLQTVVSREVSASDFAVVTVGKLAAGTKSNIIPNFAELLVNVRTYKHSVRTKVIDAIGRIARAEAAASGATVDPDVEHVESLEAVVNDQDAVERTRAALGSAGMVIDPGAVPGSEDVGWFATTAGVPCVYWALGGADPALFEGLTTVDEFMTVVAALPGNHSPQYAPVIEPTLSVGTAALAGAAREWLDGKRPR